MKKVAVFPGSFDPITKGHESIVRRSALLFDELIVAIGENSSKSNLFSLEKRKKWIKRTFKNLSNVKIESYSGLTVDFCKQINASYIIRGIRSSSDFEYEQSIAHMNKSLNKNIETILFVSEPNHNMISSSIVREIIKNKGKVDQFLPESIKHDF